MMQHVSNYLPQREFHLSYWNVGEEKEVFGSITITAGSLGEVKQRIINSGRKLEHFIIKDGDTIVYNKGTPCPTNV